MENPEAVLGIFKVNFIALLIRLNTNNGFSQKLRHNLWEFQVKMCEILKRIKFNASKMSSLFFFWFIKISFLKSPKKSFCRNFSFQIFFSLKKKNLQLPVDQLKKIFSSTKITFLNEHSMTFWNLTLVSKILIHKKLYLIMAGIKRSFWFLSGKKEERKISVNEFYCFCMCQRENLCSFIFVGNLWMMW